MRSLFLLCVLGLPASLPAQEPHSTLTTPDTVPEGHGLLNLGFHHVGLSLGNSSRWSGIRINLRDRGVRQVNGLNLTLWKAAKDANRHAIINGLAVGVVGPEAAQLTGISLGVGGAVAEQRMLGVNLGGLGLVSGGSINGINVAGLGVVADGPARGINLAGLGVVANGGVAGITIAGLGVVAEGALSGATLAGLGVVTDGPVNGVILAGLGAVAGSIRGVAVGGLGTVTHGGIAGLGLGGLAVVSDGRIDGAGLGGLALVSDGGVNGIAVGGLALVADGDIIGLGVGALAVVSDGGIAGLAVSAGEINASRISGIAVTAYRIRVRDHARGMLVASWIKAAETRGLSVAAYHQILGAQHGLAIGVFNSATELHGVQLGLLNRARNNRPPFRWLPILNVHLP